MQAGTGLGAAREERGGISLLRAAGASLECLLRGPTPAFPERAFSSGPVPRRCFAFWKPLLQVGCSKTQGSRAGSRRAMGQAVSSATKLSPHPAPCLRAAPRLCFGVPPARIWAPRGTRRFPRPPESHKQCFTRGQTNIEHAPGVHSKPRRRGTGCPLEIPLRLSPARLPPGLTRAERNTRGGIASPWGNVPPASPPQPRAPFAPAPGPLYHARTVGQPSLLQLNVWTLCPGLYGKQTRTYNTNAFC